MQLHCNKRKEKVIKENKKKKRIEKNRKIERGEKKLKPPSGLRPPLLLKKFNLIFLKQDIQPMSSMADLPLYFRFAGLLRRFGTPYHCCIFKALKRANSNPALKHIEPLLDVL